MRFVPLALLTAGLSFFAGGVWLLVSDAPAKEAARVAALARVGPADLSSAAPGTRFLLEGRLVATEPVGPRDFVAFDRESFLRVESSGATAGRQVWQRTATVRPSFAVVAGGQTADIINRDYGIEQPPHREQTEVVPRWVSLNETTERFLGFKAGDVVTIDGRGAAPAAAGRAQVEASVLFGGEAGAYVALVQRGPTNVRITGAVFAGLGALMALVAGLWLRRPRRRSR